MKLFSPLYKWKCGGDKLKCIRWHLESLDLCQGDILTNKMIFIDSFLFSPLRLAVFLWVTRPWSAGVDSWSLKHKSESRTGRMSEQILFLLSHVHVNVVVTTIGQCEITHDSFPVHRCCGDQIGNWWIVDLWFYCVGVFFVCFVLLGFFLLFVPFSFRAQKGKSGFSIWI